MTKYKTAGAVVVSAIPSDSDVFDFMEEMQAYLEGHLGLLDKVRKFLHTMGQRIDILNWERGKQDWKNDSIAESYVDISWQICRTCEFEHTRATEQAFTLSIFCTDFQAISSGLPRSVVGSDFSLLKLKFLEKL